MLADFVHIIRINCPQIYMLAWRAQLESGVVVARIKVGQDGKRHF
jgi:hypothetical protein